MKLKHAEPPNLSVDLYSKTIFGAANAAKRITDLFLADSYNFLSSFMAPLLDSNFY